MSLFVDDVDAIDIRPEHVRPMTKDFRRKAVVRIYGQGAKIENPEFKFYLEPKAFEAFLEDFIDYYGPEIEAIIRRREGDRQAAEEEGRFDDLRKAALNRGQP